MVNGKRYIVMKKYLLCVIVTILFVACDSTNDLGTPFTKGQEVTLTAVIGEQQPQMLPGMQRVSGKDSGTEINLKWDEGDQIKVIVGDKSAIFTLTSGAGSSNGSFTGIMPADGNNFRVEYPISEPDISTQTYIKDGFSNGLMKMVAENGTIDGGFILKAQHALLGLQLVGNQTLSRIVVTNPTDQKTYTLHCSNVELSNSPTLFYIVVPAGKWKDGFKVDIYDSNNTHQKTLTKSSTALFSTTQAMIMPVQGLDMIFNVNGVTFKMIYVEGGTFMMGAMDGDTQANENEKPAHKVTLSDYYMSEVQVSQVLWEVVMGTTIEEEVNKHDGDKDIGKGFNYPMYCIDWFQANEFAEKLSQLTGVQFSLPTEAEWEYAARGGKKSKGYKFAGSNNLDEVAWWGDPDGLIHPSAQKMPNELGIYDMCGNVCEWTVDGYSDYTSESQINPSVPRVNYVVQRSMSSHNAWKAVDHRITFRYKKDPKHAKTRVGIRLVLEVIP